MRYMPSLDRSLVLGFALMSLAAATNGCMTGGAADSSATTPRQPSGSTSSSSSSNSSPPMLGAPPSPSYSASSSGSGPSAASSSSSAPSGNLGFSTGGAKDIANFRENIAKDYLPLESDVTYEGLFYDYYFDTGAASECKALFCPSYVPMLSTDPLTTTQESFLSVGLNSGIKESDFARKKLNVMVVLDISSSMSSPFDLYYYDGTGKRVENTEDSGKSKLKVATESIVAMMAHLKAGDRFGMVNFDETATVFQSIAPVENTDMTAVGDRILRLNVAGGTNIEAGYKLGATELAKLGPVDSATYENRVILLTDAMPNTGSLGTESLAGMVSTRAAARIFTTFIGIGVDFNSSLIEALTKTNGANYYSVHGSAEFKKRMDTEFDFMVTPLVFNLRLTLQSASYTLKQVFGSPEAGLATGELMFVNTLFPSKSENAQTKGGVILVLLDKTGTQDGAIKLSASFQDRNGVAGSDLVDFNYAATPDQAPNTGIRKAILLVRYARLLKAWIHFERQKAGEAGNSGTISDWERTSIKLTVSEEYKAKFKTFTTYFKAEKTAIGDDTLAQEVTVLEKLSQ